jgi:hypothetical protein
MSISFVGLQAVFDVSSECAPTRPRLERSQVGSTSYPRGIPSLGDGNHATQNVYSRTFIRPTPFRPMWLILLGSVPHNWVRARRTRKVVAYEVALQFGPDSISPSCR